MKQVFLLFDPLNRFCPSDLEIISVRLFLQYAFSLRPVAFVHQKFCDNHKLSF